MSLLYDPPSGWQFGFPKLYEPLEGESIEQTLLRDGYPSELLELAKWTRFWDCCGTGKDPSDRPE